MTHRDEIREIRTPLEGNIQYESGCGDWGRAEWINISRTGAAIHLGRYLRPGHTLALLPGAEDETIPVPMPAQIIWCAPVPGTLCFKAGLTIDRTNPKTALGFATLGYAALGLNKLRSTTVTTTGWPVSHAVSPAPPHTSARPQTRAV